MTGMTVPFFFTDGIEPREHLIWLDRVKGVYCWRKVTLEIVAVGMAVHFFTFDTEAHRDETYGSILAELRKEFPEWKKRLTSEEGLSGYALSSSRKAT